MSCEVANAPRASFAAATRNLTIIDVRIESIFLNSHVVGSFNIPFDGLEQRKYELPPRHIKFFVVVEERHLEIVKDWFLQQPFNIEGFLVWENVKYLLKATNNNGVPRTSKFSFQPCPLLKEELQHIKDLVANDARANIVDLGCGSGRDVIFLAANFDRANVIAVDNLPGKLRQVQEFGQNYNLKNIFPVMKDMRKKGSLRALHDEFWNENRIRDSATRKKSHAQPVGAANDEKEIEDGFSVIVISRFLCRDIFHEIIDLLKIGGIVCVHSFMSCNSKPKKMKDKVEEGELSETFGPKYGMKVLRDTIYTQPNDGRKLSMFVAMKLHSLSRQ